MSDSEIPGIKSTNLLKQVHTPDELENGHIRYETSLIENVPPGEYRTITKMWPYNVGISSGSIRVVDLQTNMESNDYYDSMLVWVDIVHPSLVAVQQSDLGSYSIFLAPAIIAGVSLSQGDVLATGNDLDNDRFFHIVSINRETGEVKIDIQLDADLPVMTNLHMHRYFVGTPSEPYHVIPRSIRRWGEDTFDSSFLPANVPLRLSFRNNQNAGSNKTAIAELSILYGDD